MVTASFYYILPELRSLPGPLVYCSQVSRGTQCCPPSRKWRLQWVSCKPGVQPRDAALSVPPTLPPLSGWDLLSTKKILTVRRIRVARYVQSLVQREKEGAGNAKRKHCDPGSTKRHQQVTENRGEGQRRNQLILVANPTACYGAPGGGGPGPQVGGCPQGDDACEEKAAQQTCRCRRAHLHRGRTCGPQVYHAGVGWRRAGGGGGGRQLRLMKYPGCGASRKRVSSLSTAGGACTRAPDSSSGVGVPGVRLSAGPPPRQGAACGGPGPRCRGLGGLFHESAGAYANKGFLPSAFPPGDEGPTPGTVETRPPASEGIKARHQSPASSMTGACTASSGPDVKPGGVGPATAGLSPLRGYFWRGPGGLESGVGVGVGDPRAYSTRSESVHAV